MSNTTATTISKLMVALSEHEQAKKAKPEDNPLHDRKLTDLVHSAGITKSADKFPAKNMAPESPSGYELEVARNEARKTEKDAKVNQRRARQRAAAERKLAFDKIADSPVKPDAERMEQAWLVVYPLVPIVTKIALSKQRWAARFLGSVADDIPQMALEKMAIVLAKGERYDLQQLRVAARQLGGMAKTTNMVPGDQVSDEKRKQRKVEAKNRKLLMGLANNRVMGALVDVYTLTHNLRWDNIDLIATTMANINGVGEDNMTARFKADRAPAFLGSRFATPGGFDPNLLAVAISGGITAHGLDPIVEIILNEDNRRVDGAVKWSACAEQIFLATPGGHGQWMWDRVMTATEHLQRPRHARGNAARIHTQNLFQWLPPLITSVIDSFDPHFLHWSQEGHRAVMASDFELFYCGDPEIKRKYLQPALRYATVREAAVALNQTLAQLTTGKDMVEAIQNG